LPSAANGVTGLKPTWGRVSRAGAFELAATFDHVGPLTRSAADAGAMLGVIAGADADDPTASHEPVPDYLGAQGGNLRGLRIGLDEELAFGKSEKIVEQSIRSALEAMVSLGAVVVAVRVPDIDAVAASYLPLSGVQTAVAHAETYPSKREHYGKALADIIDKGRSLSATEYHRFQLRLLNFRSQLHGLFKRVDILALPVLPFSIPTIWSLVDPTDDMIQSIVRFTAPFSMSGHPTINFPCGFAGNRGPISLQLVGAYFRELMLIRSACAFQRDTDWHTRRPLP
jgi:amidase